MLSFKKFISEANLSGGVDAHNHAKKYLDPYIQRGELGSHTLSKGHDGIEDNSSITIHGHGIDEKGKRYAEVSSLNNPTKRVRVPFSKIKKPVSQKNKGFDYETSLVNRLNQHGLMAGTGAGFSGANDFHLINKRKNKVHEGTAVESQTQGESKKDLSAAFGQASLKHHPEKGWHFDEKTRKRFPEYVRSIENASITVDGKSKSLLDHVNDTYGPPDPEKKSSTNLYSDQTDLSPMHSYLKDHNVDVLHVGSHGTFRAGQSGDEDRTGTDLPKAEGNGRFRVRQKHRNSLTVQFNVRNLNKSHVNMENDEGIQHLKQRLGHTE